MIPVTKPFLPPKEEYEIYLTDIWQRNWLTNNGPLVNEFELQLKQYLKLRHLLFVSNGTIALQIAIKALGLKGEIITTPFSYVATTSSIVWEGCTPVFVDIDPQALNIDPNKIEAAITPRTSAIIATHVYGNPCDIEAIEAIAKRNNLKVIYDAAHAFGVQYKGKSIFAYGDISTASFHATKVFHTIEGGGVFTQDPDLLKRMAYMRNFGHDGPEKFNGVGINGKNSEFHAAMGLCNLPYITPIIEARKANSILYDKLLTPYNLGVPTWSSHATINYAYYPILLKNENELLRINESLLNNKVSSRRYFYPLLNSLDYVYSSNTPIAFDISNRVLCLPLYFDLTAESIEFITHIIADQLKQ